MIRIVEEPADQFIRNNESLIRANWSETGFDFDLDLDVELYMKLHYSSVMTGLAAYDGDRAVGFVTFMISPLIFKRGSLIAMHDAIFIEPEYRGGLLCGRLIKTAERVAKEKGASFFMWQPRTGTDFDKVFRRRNYAELSTVFMRGL